ncbi:MAG: fixJ [Bradyrhizobium sp.]|nr:fixJ [Bradyrhizobium sp.]
MTRNIHIVDDDDTSRASLYDLLSTEPGLLVRTFRDGGQFLEQSPELESGLLLLDVDAPESGGMDVLKAVRASNPDKYAGVILTGKGNVDTAVEAMKTGAVDLIEKPYLAETLLSTVQSAFATLQRHRAVAAATMQARAKIKALSPREADVLKCLLQGSANKVIAYELNISPRTVEVYRANLMSKLSVRSLAEVIRIALTADPTILGGACSPTPLGIHA